MSIETAPQKRLRECGETIGHTSQNLPQGNARVAIRFRRAQSNRGSRLHRHTSPNVCATTRLPLGNLQRLPLNQRLGLPEVGCGQWHLPLLKRGDQICR